MEVIFSFTSYECFQRSYGSLKDHMTVKATPWYKEFMKPPRFLCLRVKEEDKEG